jgi:hypothetical protein
MVGYVLWIVLFSDVFLIVNIPLEQFSMHSALYIHDHTHP